MTAMVLSIIVVLSLLIYTYFPTKCEYLTGRDTIAVFGNGFYQISKVPGRKILEIHFERGEKISTEAILKYVTSYQRALKLVYVRAKDGYAVINTKDNTCKLFLTEGNKMAMGFPEIQYLSAFEEFSNAEQWILNLLD